MKTNDNKQKLFEVMSRLDKTFKPKLNETGEWSGDEDDVAWMESLRDAVNLIATETGGKLKLIDIKGFDKYQGPYAIVEIDGKKYNIWTMEDYGILWIEDFPYDNTSGKDTKAGFQGSIPEIVDVINNTGNAPRNQMYRSFSLNEKFDDATTKQIIGTLIDAKNNIQDIFEKLPIATEIPQEEAKVLEDAMKILHKLESRYSTKDYGIGAIQEGRGDLKRMTIFLMYDKNGGYLGDLTPIDEEQRASEFYENTKSEVFATPEFQKFAQEKNITPEQIGRIKKDYEYTMNGNPLSFEYYAPSDSQELYDEKTRTFYNRSGQQLRNPEEYDRTNPEWTPFGDEGDNY